MLHPYGSTVYDNITHQRQSFASQCSLSIMYFLQYTTTDSLPNGHII